jgi:replicative DNA helicase
MPLPKETPRTIAQICSWITRAARHDGIKVAYIDHLDHVVLEPARGQSTAGAYADAMKRLAECAGREQVGIVFLSQVSREVRKSESVVPEMWMMRESGSKEEASQIVLMLGLADDHANALHPDLGRWMHVKVAKVKDYAGNRLVTVPNSEAPALWLDDRSGAVREIGERL